jgi:hypothetical protein
VICSSKRPSRYWLKVKISIPLLNRTNGSRKLIPVINRIMASQFLLSADWLAIISYLQRGPIEMDKPHIFA